MQKQAIVGLPKAFLGEFEKSPGKAADQFGKLARCIQANPKLKSLDVQALSKAVSKCALTLIDAANLAEQKQYQALESFNDLLTENTLDKNSCGLVMIAELMEILTDPERPFLVHRGVFHRYWLVYVL